MSLPAQGTVVPLSQIARVRYELEEPVLWRRNRDMAITVRADVKDGEQGVSVTQAIRPMLKDIEAKLPFGYRIDVGGAVEESDKANRSLAAVIPMMVLTILAILMLQLQNFSRLWMVVLTAPLGLIGVVAALLLFRAPLGFVAILGVIALQRDDHAQFGDPGPSGARGDGRGGRPMERGGRRCRPSDPPGGPDGGGRGARHDSAVAQRVLGPHGDRDHGRPHRGDGADDLLRAGPLRRVVQDRTPRCAESGPRACPGAMKGDARLDSMVHTPAEARACRCAKKRTARRTQPGAIDNRPNIDLSLTTRRCDPTTLSPSFACDICDAS